MEALLADLGRDRGRVLRRVLALAAVLALVAAGAVVTRRLIARGASCDGGDKQLAGIWDAPARERLHAAFRATGKPHAEATWARRLSHT